MNNYLLSLGLSAALAGSAFADSNTTNKIETVTVLGKSNVNGAEIAGIEIKSLPINTHVVGNAEIERIKFVDPDELLDRIPGETQVRNLRIPDGGKSYTIPLLDGVPLENPYEGATQRLDLVNTGDIQRVEIIKGPASALFANNAFGGVVNVVSRKPPQESEGHLSMEFGNLNRFRASAGVGGTRDNLGYSFNLNSRNLDGLRDGAKDDRRQASGKLVYLLSDETEITARFEYLDELAIERGDLTAEQLAEDKHQAGSLSSSIDLEQSALSVKLEHNLDNAVIEANIVRREKDSIGLSRFRGPQDENDLAYSGKFIYRHEFDSSNLAVGYERYDGTQDTKQYDRSDVDLAGDFTEFQNELEIDAYFTQYMVNPTENIAISLGARNESINLYSSLFQQGASFSDTSPKFGVTYQLTDNQMLWFGASKGFYAPDSSDLFDLEEGNPNLSPEQATNLEFGLRGSLGDFSYDSSYYDMDVTDYLVTQELVRVDGTEYEQTTNAGEVSLRGLETVLEYAPKNSSWRVGVTHTFSRNHYVSFVQSTPGASDDLSGKQLRRTPKHHINIRTAWLPTSDLTVELELDAYSRYYADHANSAGAEFTRDERLNLRVDYLLGDWRFWLHALNLTDTLEDRATFSRGAMKYRTANGRNWYLGTSYQF